MEEGSNQFIRKISAQTLMLVSIKVESSKGWNLKDGPGGKVEDKISVRLSLVSVWLVKLSQRQNK